MPALFHLSHALHGAARAWVLFAVSSLVTGHLTLSHAAGPTGLLNDTGQTLCYDGTAMVACTAANTDDASTRPRQDGRFGRDVGSPVKLGAGVGGFDFTKVCMDGSASCISPVDTTVSPSPDEWACTTDNVTGLTWSLYNGTGNFAAAQALTATHNGQSRCGGLDWRLPTLQELLSIVNYGRTNPSVDVTYFPSTAITGYWTNDAYVGNTNQVWGVGSSTGNSVPILKTNSLNIRLVSGGPAVASAFTDNLDGTVTDTVTGLMWDQAPFDLSCALCAPGSTMTGDWPTALSAAVTANTVTHKTYSDWRLPNVKELASLVKLTASPVAIETSVFTGTVAANFWSSTPYNSANAWHVNFGTGSTHFNTIPAGYVRLVRSSQSLAAFDLFALLLAQAITGFAPTSPVVFGAGAATLISAGGGSNIAIVYATSSAATVCTVTGNQVSFMGVGTCDLTANQTGNATYSAAPQVTASIVINRANQTLNFGALPTPVIGNGGTVNATSSSGLTGIAYASTTPAVCTVGPASGVITVLSAGLCTLTADLGVSANYFAAPQISQDFTIAPALGSAAAPFTGNTVPPAGAGAPASASFTSATGGIACRFDPLNTAFVASLAPHPAPGSLQPHGAFKFKLIGCTPGFSAQISVTWPSLAGTSVLKYGKASALAASNSFFAPPALSVVGNMATYTVTDGQLGDDDWLVDGAISDPLVPVALPIAPVPTLGQWGLLLLAGLFATMGCLSSRTQWHRYLLSK